MYYRADYSRSSIKSCSMSSARGGVAFVRVFVFSEYESDTAVRTQLRQLLKTFNFLVGKVLVVVDEKRLRQDTAGGAELCSE